MAEFKTIYKLSHDYDRLFDLICEGYEIPAWVDYKFNDEPLIMCRDICSLRRFKSWDIRGDSRGHGYLVIHVFDSEKIFNPNELNEREMFKLFCGGCNLEYIEV